ncbi:MAG: peptide chain release factor N(5)-glutamine methyltransferase [Buchnera aphidicola (Kaburagia rhusicola ensigallis)]
MNIKSWLDIACLKLNNSNNKLDAEVLLSHILNRSIDWLVGHSSYKISKNDCKQLNDLLERRINGEPIAYLIKQKEFWSLPFVVSYDTLIPRPDTEILVEQTLTRLDNVNYKSILDLGTGCGCIALTLASIKFNCYIVGVDFVQKAIYIAKKNAKILQLNNVVFFHSFWFSSVNQTFDIIVSNPPYISLNEIDNLEKELLFEPLAALVSSDNGLGSIRYIIKNSKKYLKNMGWLLIEHGWMQKVRVQKLFKKYNFFNIVTYQDYSGNNRITVGQKR